MFPLCSQDRELEPTLGLRALARSLEAVYLKTTRVEMLILALNRPKGVTKSLVRQVRRFSRNPLKNPAW